MSSLSEQVPVAETFYSIQGEGPTMGRPSVFLRCSHCNLRCPAWGPLGSPQGCDTTDVWSKVWARMTPSEIVDYWSEQGWFGHLLGGAHLILTGGEPTLLQPQLTVLLELVAQNCGSHYLKMPWVEVETNATIPLVHEFDFWVNQYNCSPKLRSAGNDRMKSYVPLVLREHALKTHKSIFKFVVQDLEKDVEEILYDYVVPFEIREDRVYLMPEGATRERLLERSEAVAELCKKYGFNFSSRLQLMLWNKATGV